MDKRNRASRPISFPLPQNQPAMTARTVNGFAVLRFAPALRVTARPLHGRARLSGRGTSFRLRRRSQPLRGIEQGTGSKFCESGTAGTGGEIAGAWRGGACGPSLPLGSPYRAFGWFFPCPCTSEPFSRPCEAPRRQNGQGCPSGHPKGLALSILPDGSRGESENGVGCRDNLHLGGFERESS